MVAATAVAATHTLKRNKATTIRGIIFFILAGILAAATSFISVQLQPTVPLLFFGGFCAISAMLLPGISGSLVLLVIGLYQPISIAARHLDLPVLLPVAGGAVCGAVCMIPLLHHLFQHLNDIYAALSGLLAGSLIAVWPWKTHYFANVVAVFGPQRPLWPTPSEMLGPCAVAAAAIFIVAGAQWYRRKMLKKDNIIQQAPVSVTHE